MSRPARTCSWKHNMIILSAKWITPCSMNMFVLSLMRWFLQHAKNSGPRSLQSFRRRWCGARNIATQVRWVSPKMGLNRASIRIAILSEHSHERAERDHGHLPGQHFLPQNPRQRPNEGDPSAQCRPTNHHNERVSIINALASGLNFNHFLLFSWLT